MGYSIDPISTNCYSSTTALINKFNIREEERLNEVESVLASARYGAWLSTPKVETFDFDHYKVIHRFLFSDLYDWAEEVYTVNIIKKGIQFAPVEQIESQATKICDREWQDSAGIFDPHCDPHEEMGGRKQRNRQDKTLIIRRTERLQKP